MTFQEFQDSKRPITPADVVSFDLESADVYTGFLYLGEWWISSESSGAFWTMMFNEDFASDRLEEVELWLFDRIVES